MKIGILGPSKVNDLEKINPSARQIISEVIGFLTGQEIYLTPDKGSVSEFFAQEYLNQSGEKLFSVIPLDDKEFGFDWVNSSLGEKINCEIWRNQPEKLNEVTEALICFGYSTGVLAEIAYSKWFPKGKPAKPIYIIKELISKELPSEAVKKLNIKYVSYKDLEKMFPGAVSV